MILFRKFDLKSIAILRKLKTAFFLFVKKPFYTYRYNINNTFECNGIINGSIIIDGYNNEITIQSGAILNNVSIVIRGDNNKLIIQKGVIFHEKGKIIMEDDGNTIDIGERTNIMGAYFAVRDCNKKLIIGKECLLSSEVVIRTSDAHSILDMNNHRINNALDTIIKDHVWIGYGATILKGAIIETDCVVGTQCVVTRMTIPHNSIVAGNPGRVIKSGITWCMERTRE